MQKWLRVRVRVDCCLRLVNDGSSARLPCMSPPAVVAVEVAEVVVAMAALQVRRTKGRGVPFSPVRSEQNRPSSQAALGGSSTTLHPSDR